jgi:hypothetical protein
MPKPARPPKATVAAAVKGVRRAGRRTATTARQRKAPRGEITIAAATTAITFAPTARLAAEAMRWSYRLRNRLRWKDSPESRRRLGEESVSSLAAIGLDPERLRAIANDGLIEVTVPYAGEQASWPARLFPWEFVLSSATRKLDRTQDLTVVRHLDRGARGAAAAAAFGAGGPKVLFVESRPGVLAELYEFTSERAAVEQSLAPCRFELCLNPSPDDLRRKVRDLAPDVIHLAGFDTHQARALLQRADPDAMPKRGDPAAAAFERDGYVLTSNRRPVVVDADALAEVLAGGARPPRFVGCNLYDSALRVAAMIVAAGASAALGFRDLQDDVLMEQFFVRFYRAWREGRGAPLAGFRAGWSAVRAQPTDLRGTSVVLWSRTPLLQRRDVADAVSARVAKQETAILEPPRAGIGEWAWVEVVPKERINYSLLHNQRSLFERFRIHKLKPGRMTDVSVEVELMVGSERLGYRSTFDVVTSPHDLARDVRVPLAWALARELHEKVRTTLFVDVRWQGRVLKRDTLHTVLLPVSEWSYATEDDFWLPSFVLPRDPAVLKIVAAAQRYLIALDDDPTAGFDGYQSVTEDDPGVTDRRVQALWHALTQDLVLGYIDPPPVYSPESQRLRTPSEVLNGGRGTCIDLALMLASCFEFIDLYPVLFLLDDHAFPGYWTTQEAHDEFASVRGESATATVDATRLGSAEAWSMGPDNFEEIRALIESGKLVALETVNLTRRTSFAQAKRDVRTHFALRHKSNFSSMLDIAIAREHWVTPLPFPEGPVLDGRP